MHIGDDRTANIVVIEVGNMERTGATVALDQRHNLLHGSNLAAKALLCRAADKGFVALDNLSRPAER